jgi:hypothetical protein
MWGRKIHVILSIMVLIINLLQMCDLEEGELVEADEGSFPPWYEGDGDKAAVDESPFPPHLQASISVTPQGWKVEGGTVNCMVEGCQENEYSRMSSIGDTGIATTGDVTPSTTVRSKTVMPPQPGHGTWVFTW